MKSLTYSRDSIMDSEGKESLANTEAWTKTERLNSRLVFPMGQYWITYATIQETETSRPVHLLAIQPALSVLALDYALNPYGVLGRRRPDSFLCLIDLDMVSVCI